MFDTELLEQLARELNQSKNSRVQIEQFTKRFPDMTIEDGYKISRAWLANKLAPWGETLQPGQIVLAGSFTRPVIAQVRDIFKADYGQLGQLNFRFA